MPDKTRLQILLDSVDGAVRFYTQCADYLETIRPDLDPGHGLIIAFEHDHLSIRYNQNGDLYDIQKWIDEGPDTEMVVVKRREDRQIMYYCSLQSALGDIVSILPAKSCYLSHTVPRTVKELKQSVSWLKSLKPLLQKLIPEGMQENKKIQLGIRGGTQLYLTVDWNESGNLYRLWRPVEEDRPCYITLMDLAPEVPYKTLEAGVVALIDLVTQERKTYQELQVWERPTPIRTQKSQHNDTFAKIVGMKDEKEMLIASLDERMGILAEEIQDREEKIEKLKAQKAKEKESLHIVNQIIVDVT